MERGRDRGDSTDVFHAGGVNSIGPNGISTGLSYPDTKAYQGGNIIDTEVTISNISSSGSIMTLDITFGSRTTSSPVTSPTTSPVASPTTSPVASPTATMAPSNAPPSSDCDDSPLRFRVRINGRLRTRSCQWVATTNTSARCSLSGVSATCPSTCGSCSTCVDSSLKFRVEINGRFRTRRCLWAARRPNTRCSNFVGVSETCRSACSVC